MTIKMACTTNGGINELAIVRKVYSYININKTIHMVKLIERTLFLLVIRKYITRYNAVTIKNNGPNTIMVLLNSNKFCPVANAINIGV